MLADQKKDWRYSLQSFFHSPNSLLSQRLAYGCLLLLGGLLTLSYSPFDAWWVAFFALPVFILSIVFAPNARQAAKYGFVFGLGLFGVGISWVHNAIADYGGLPLVFSLLLMLLLVGYLALYPAVVGWLTYKLHNKLTVFIIVPIWLSVEYLRSVLFTGFPWLSIGYSQLTSPLAGFAPVMGETGLQAIIMLLVCLISCLFIPPKTANKDKKSTYLMLLSPVLIAVIVLTGMALKNQNWATPINKSVNLALVQGNVPQSIKWQPENELPTMLKYYDLSADHWAESDIVIWPEAAIPRLEVSAKNFLLDLENQALEANSALITGIVDFQPNTQYAYNNVIALGKQNSNDNQSTYQYLHSNRYSKHHLLPFGEFVPFESVLRKLAPIFNLPFSSFNRGQYQQANLVANGFDVVSAICFEIAFAKQVRANITEQSDFILTLSNDAWFGDSHGPWQHLQIAQMRALEFAMPVVRVTNNGVTAVIDHKGEIADLLEQNVTAVLNSKLNLVESHSVYKQFGDLIVFILMLVFTSALVVYSKLKNVQD